MRRLFVAAIVALAVTPIGAHVTPPRVLLQDSDALHLLIPEGQDFSRVDLKLNDDQKQEARKLLGWTPDQRSYKTYVAKDAQGRSCGRVVFIGDITIHGIIQLAVAVDTNERVRGVSVVAITDEAYGWVKPLTERNFNAQFVGKRPTDAYVSDDRAAARRGSMEQFYGQIIATIVQRGAVVCHVAAKPV